MTQTAFPLTRAAALSRLNSFAPEAGPAYARLRNLDRGPEGHPHVSRLSAALRRRLIAEPEVIAAVLSHHTPEAAEKFISEVFWRNYWKGWLESRPAVWSGYLDATARAENRIAADAALTLRHAEACAGRTGIDCFDAWVAELETTGYLHNWARMQFASIWVFTLGLPWELGAAFTLARFVDGDPASNTLSWRWVAGLHTAGKAYLSDADRIARMTGGRFAPQGLARQAILPADSIAVPQATPPRAARTPDPAAPGLLLLGCEDLSLETLPALQSLPVQAIATLPGTSAADQIALADGLARASHHWPQALPLGPLTPAALDRAAAEGCRQIITAFAPVGPLADRLALLRPAASAAGLPVTEVLRPWDARVWPHCRKGFFALKERIPALLAPGLPL